jgi:guanylate kinase
VTVPAAGRRRLFVVSGPSGSGKTSLCHAWMERCPQLRLSISSTTRLPRPGEVDGRDYHFLNPEEFERQLDAGAFLESAVVHGNRYGTRRNDVERMLAEGFDVLLEIDWQGAQQVAAKMPGAFRIFIMPPSMAELRRRLTSRGQDSAEVMAQRLAAAESEMAHADEAHVRIVNDDFSQALEHLLALYHGG